MMTKKDPRHKGESLGRSGSRRNAEGRKFSCGKSRNFPPVGIDAAATSLNGLDLCQQYAVDVALDWRAQRPCQVRYTNFLARTDLFRFFISESIL
jgi:hypothetical protein